MNTTFATLNNGVYLSVGADDNDHISNAPFSNETKLKDAGLSKQTVDVLDEDTMNEDSTDESSGDDEMLVEEGELENVENDYKFFKTAFKIEDKPAKSPEEVITLLAALGFQKSALIYKQTFNN